MIELENRLHAIEERSNNATPGPWYWNGVIANKDVDLLTVKNGHQRVMGFVRWGMSEAAPAFRTVDGMQRVETLAVPRQKHRPDGEFNEIDHPDAQFIAHAREDVPFLLQQLRASLERERMLQNGLNGALTHLLKEEYEDAEIEIVSTLSDVKQMRGES